MPEKAPCQLVEIEGEEAVARTYLLSSGYELPRVGFPAKLLTDLGLKIGDWFYWTMTGREEIFPEDIDPNGQNPFPEQMSAEEKADLDRLFEEFQKWDREPWPEYTGPGD